MIRDQKKKNKIRKYIFIYSILWIPILRFFVMYLYLNFDSILMAFQDQHTGEWGFSNFQLFFNDIARGAESSILMNVKNTLFYFFEGIILNFASFILAYFIYKKIWGYKLFRFAFMIPMIISSVALVAIYTYLLESSGPVSVLWEAITGQTAPKFLYSYETATPAILAFQAWTGVGGNLIMFAGAMNRIPDSVIEAGQLDGVTPMREMWQIVLPLIAPTFGTIMLLSCVNVFGASGPILLFTGGTWGTSTIGYWMYENVILHRQYNYASAFGLILSVASLPIFFLVTWLTKKLPDAVEY